MRGDSIILEQLINSMYEAVEKLEQAKRANKIQEFNDAKKLILEIQKKIDEELE